MCFFFPFAFMSVSSLFCFLFLCCLLDITDRPLWAPLIFSRTTTTITAEVADVTVSYAPPTALSLG